ncbi:hypothetical protein [Streptomyces brasiliensis]|uniref:hypothetical protein n=1 Tax=Streptomyces brasiliensis TaxID=1954 RepID=UPI00167057F7|nr:hypothetical protein [Streptomyces brasiliensis]
MTPQDYPRTRNGGSKGCSRHPGREHSRRSSIEDSHTARGQFNIDEPLGDAVAIVSRVLADWLGIGFGDDPAIDRLDG